MMHDFIYAPGCVHHAVVHCREQRGQWTCGPHHFTEKDAPTWTTHTELASSR